jgi:hypothetical protein
MSGLDSRYISAISLEPYFVSNQNAEANAGGIVTFYKNNQRTSQKSVFELSQDPLTGDYSYVALPNPLTLSGIGTFQDAGGNNVAVYYFPYDAIGNVELYYITVYDAFGNLQFTRQAWPFPNISGSSAAANAIGLTNQLSNPQFALINFVSPLTVTIGATPTTTTIPIAPDWSLVVVNTGASSVTVTQTAIVGSLKLPYNPPFTLDITYGANLSSVQLIQTLNNNPDWAAPSVTGVMGYLSGSILISNGTSVTMQYKPSNGNATQQILAAANATGSFVQYPATVQLAAANNPDNGTTGFDQIIINLLSATSRISNVQAIPLTSNISNVQYDQTPVNRQIDHLFNYYNSLLQFKPIPSYLVGWDFPLAPFQPLGTAGGPYATGNNSSVYINDTTIVFQSLTSGFTWAQDTSIGGLTLTAAANNVQLAMIQYLPAYTSRDLVFQKICSMVEANTNITAGIPICVSIWATANGSLPSTVVSNISLVTTLDATGHPSAVAAGWTELSRSLLGNATATVGLPGAQETDLTFNSYPFAFWNGSGLSFAATTTYLAIVIGTAPIANTKHISFNSVSLQQGFIPTHPGAQTADQVLSQCQRYYRKTFLPGVVPAQAVGLNTGYYSFPATKVGTAAMAISPFIPFSPPMVATPSALTLYNPANADAQILDQTTAVSCSLSAYANLTVNGFYLDYTGDAGAQVGYTMSVHYAVDARLGY